MFKSINTQPSWLYDSIFELHWGDHPVGVWEPRLMRSIAPFDIFINFMQSPMYWSPLRWFKDIIWRSSPSTHPDLQTNNSRVQTGESRTNHFSLSTQRQLIWQTIFNCPSLQPPQEAITPMIEGNLLEAGREDRILSKSLRTLRQWRNDLPRNSAELGSWHCRIF